MTLNFEIRNVDKDAYLDIQYFIHRYFLKIEGMIATGEGSGTSLDNPNGTMKEIFRVERS